MTPRKNQGFDGAARPNRESGFTLVELLVVLVILGVLTAVAAPQVIRYLDRAKSDAAGLQIQAIGTALDLYRLDVGRYPSEQEGLRALLEQPAGADRWLGPYLRKADVLIDPWGRGYLYRIPGRHGEYDLHSLGADNAPGGAGANRDVTSW